MGWNERMDNPFEYRHEGALYYHYIAPDSESRWQEQGRAAAVGGSTDERPPPRSPFERTH